MSIGIGIVGCGLIGQKRAANVPTGARVVACYDLDPERAASFANAHPGVGVAVSLDELLGRDDVDLVLVATTHDVLPVVGMAAVNAGKHVLLEKPGAAARAPLAELRDAARTANRVVRVGFNHRFHPAFLQVHGIVRSGEHGQLLFVRARYGHGGRLGYEREWRADPARSGGGQLVDQGSHLLDLVHFLFGDADLAFAELQQAFWDMPVEDSAFVALRPRSGGFAWLHASWAEWKNIFSFEVMLQHAKLEVTGLGGSYGPERLTVYAMQPGMGPPPSTTWEHPPSDHSWHAELEDVLAEIRDREAGRAVSAIGASIDDALHTLTLIDEAYRR